MLNLKYPELFDYIVEEIKPYINNGNNKDDIYNLFIDITDKGSLKYILSDKELLTISDTASDMEEYIRLTEDNNWIEKLFNEVYEKCFNNTQTNFQEEASLTGIEDVLNSLI